MWKELDSTTPCVGEQNMTSLLLPFTSVNAMIIVLGHCPSSHNVYASQSVQ